MAHSPLPWRIDLQDEPPRLIDALGVGVADEQEFGSCVIEPEDQALIVPAVNAHADLVVALNACKATEHNKLALLMEIGDALELARKVGE